MTNLTKPMDRHTNVLLIVTLASQTPQAKPFQKENENGTYAHISSLCEQEGINLYISHFANAINDSSVLSWTFKNGTWNMVELPAAKVAATDCTSL